MPVHEYEPHVFDPQAIVNNMSKEEIEYSQDLILDVIRKNFKEIAEAAKVSEDHQRASLNRSYPAFDAFGMLYLTRDGYKRWIGDIVKRDFAEMVEAGIEASAENMRDMSELAVANGWKLPKQLGYWLRGLDARLIKPNASSPNYRFRDKSRLFRIVVDMNGVHIEAMLSKSYSWGTCLAASCPMQYTQETFTQAIKNLRIQAAARDIEVEEKRAGPPDLGYWCMDLGMTESFSFDHNYKWNNRRWRLNGLGEWQMSCVLEDFDRWANSVEVTFHEDELWNRELFMEKCRALAPETEEL